MKGIWTAEQTCVDQFENEVEPGRVHNNVLEFDHVRMLELSEQHDFSEGGGGNAYDLMSRNVDSRVMTLRYADEDEDSDNCLGIQNIAVEDYGCSLEDSSASSTVGTY